MVRLTGLWKKVDKKGRMYLEGSINEHFFNQLHSTDFKPEKILIFEIDSPSLNSPDYAIYVAEKSTPPV